MRPSDLGNRLNRLAELAGKNQDLRRVLENVDLIAQAALDAEATYVNKKGDAVTVEAPQWAVALKAQQIAASLLGLDATDGAGKQQASAESPVARILAAVPKAGGGT